MLTKVGPRSTVDAMAMSEQEVIQLIRSQQGERSLREYAEAIGVSAQYLSQIYNGKCSPGPSCLRHFGLVKFTKTLRVYEYAAKKSHLRKAG